MRAITGTCAGDAAGYGPCFRPCGMSPCTVDQPTSSTSVTTEGDTSV